MTGKLIEMGDLECLQNEPEPNKSGVVILIDRAQLKASRNLFGETVTVDGLSSPKTVLPLYAFPYAHPAAGRGDVGAEFRGEDGGTICIGIERMEGGMLSLQLGRSGLGENCFSHGELAKVLELAGILFSANGKQPERMK